MAIKKTYKYRIDTNPAIAHKLQWVLDRCRNLYNAALSERRDAYEYMVRHNIGYYDLETRKALAKEFAVTCFDQIKDLPEIKQLCPEYQEIGSHVLQDVLRRLEKSFVGFFRRVALGLNPGYPRFQGRNRYCSFAFPDQAGWKLETQTRPAEKKGMVRIKLHLTKIGTVKLHLHRDMAGKVKTLTMKKEGDEWYAVFSCECNDPLPLPESQEATGVDVGLNHFAALANGDFIENPRWFRESEEKVAQLSQALKHKKNKRSHRRAKAIKQLSKAHRKVRRQRDDFQHKESRKLVNQYQILVFEALQIANLVKRPEPKQDEATGKYLPNGASAKSGLNKSIHDAGWGNFMQKVAYKAAWAGRTFLQVDPKYTSQLCSGCGAVVKKALSDRWHSCDCGTALDRDTNSARLLLARGYMVLGRKGPTQATA